ncbi:hypothetical protein [Erythrobacter longus]|nr:hypothetical protein [Erythrobacter longus]
MDAAKDDAPLDGAPLGGTKAEATQRLQIGLFGLVSMVLLIGLATIIGNQADRTQESAVPDAAPTTEPAETSQQRDPLASAGIVPDIPAEPTPGASATPGASGAAGQQGEGQPVEDVGPRGNGSPPASNAPKN